MHNAVNNYKYNLSGHAIHYLTTTISAASGGGAPWMIHKMKQHAGSVIGPLFSAACKF